MIGQPNSKMIYAFAAMAIAVCITATTAHAQTLQDLNASANKVTRPREGCARPEGILRTVIGVPDAHTLLLDDGTEVRLSGALPPFRPAVSATNPPVSAPWPPLEQAHQALAKLAQAQTVQLGADQGEPNRYGQIMAQVYIIPQTSADTPPRARLWLQGQLVGKGLARAYSLPDGSARGSSVGRGGSDCLAQLLNLERAARTAQTGLWGYAAFQIRDAANPETLTGDIGSFQIIEGRVLRTGGGRNKFYLNFGKNWRRDFTVGINRKLARQFARDGLKLRRLRGRTIRVRGWLERRGGPYIQATNAAQIEVLADD